MFISFFLCRKWVHLLCALHYLFLFLQYSYACFYNKYLANTCHRTLLCHCVLVTAYFVMKQSMHLQGNQLFKKHWELAFEVYHESRADVFIWIEADFGEWGNPEQHVCSRMAFTGCFICSEWDKKQAVSVHV